MSGIKVNLVYTEEQIDELLNTLWLCRNLLCKYIYEIDTKYGEKHLITIDDLIDCITISQNMERFDKE